MINAPLLLAQASVYAPAPPGVPTNLGDLLTWAIRIIFLIGGVIVGYYVITGALDWVQSGGDKEKVETARKKITTAIIGLIILFATVAIVALVENIFGVGLGITRAIYFPPIGLNPSQVKACISKTAAAGSRYMIVPKPGDQNLAAAYLHDGWACCPVSNSTGVIGSCASGW